MAIKQIHFKINDPKAVYYNEPGDFVLPESYDPAEYLDVDGPKGTDLLFFRLDINDLISPEFDIMSKTNTLSATLDADTGCTLITIDVDESVLPGFLNLINKVGTTVISTTDVPA